MSRRGDRGDIDKIPFSLFILFSENHLPDTHGHARGWWNLQQLANVERYYFIFLSLLSSFLSNICMFSCFPPHLSILIII